MARSSLITLVSDLRLTLDHLSIFERKNHEFLRSIFDHFLQEKKEILNECKNLFYSQKYCALRGNA